MSVHSINRSQKHSAWDNRLTPVLRVASGDIISVDCNDASSGQMTPTSTADMISSLQLSEFNHVNGPIHVHGAEPGDTLQVDVLTIETADWGWTINLPGFGLLAEEFPDPAVKIYKINSEEGYAWFDEERGIRIPVKPFAGEMGVARSANGSFSTVPPYNTGGNIDTRHITAGSTLFLPVEVAGALFSIGDGHAAQGDGEVCGSAIETSIKATVRLTVIKNKPYIKTPHFRARLACSDIENGDEYYCTTGVGGDILETTRDAVRHMITFLSVEYGLDKISAYMLCSVAGDVRLHEVVDMPNYVVGIMLPKSIFTK